MRGRFISVEGGEGAGKSSCLGEIMAVLQDAGIRCVETREPGGTALGERIRELLLAPETGKLAPMAELLLVYAARAQLLSEVIEPRLAEGSWVIADRFSDASFAYQGGGRGVSQAEIEALDARVVGNRKPDLTVLLDVAPEAGLDRATRDRRPDRFEIETVAFYRRVREAYLARAEQEPHRIRVIDASRPLPEVRRQVGDLIRAFLSEKVAP